MAEIAEILVIHHTHTDVGYTHPQPVVFELQRRFIDEAIELCERTADWPEASRARWTCEVTLPLLQWLRHPRTTSRQIERFRRLVAAGQLGAGAMMLNITPLYNAQQLARCLEPVRTLRRELGLPMKSAINHDVNGLPWPVVGHLRDADVELLLMGINIHFGAFPLTRPIAFRWLGPDARELLAFNGEHYQAFDREAQIAKGTTAAMAEGLGKYLSRLKRGGYPYDFVYLTATHHAFADNNPPNAHAAEMVRRWNAEGRIPSIRFVLPEELLQRIRRQPPDTIKQWSGDWTDYWNFGCASSAAETRVNRHARSRLMAAEALYVMQGPDSTTALPPLALEEAWLNTDLYDEHTWGSFCMMQTHNVDPALEQWYQKAAYAYRARSLSALLVRDEMNRLAGNPPCASVGQQLRPSGIVIYNPAPIPKTELLRVPNSVLTGSWEYFSSNILRLDVDRDLWSDANSTIIGPVSLPAYGYRYFALSELSPAIKAEAVTAGEGFIESPSHRLRFDPGSGRIVGLLDKRSSVEYVDTRSPWQWFGLVRETPDPSRHDLATRLYGREAFFDFDGRLIHGNVPSWKTDWIARREPPTRLRSCQTDVSAAGARLTLAWEAPGVEDFEQQITLPAHRAVVGLSAQFNKIDVRTPESIYFTFPTPLRNWRAHFDTAGVPVEFDVEQLPGTCRGWLTVGQWVCIHSLSAGMTLACPDAPMVQIGDFNFARNLCQSCDRIHSALLLAWPMNNYWDTNFRASQPGYVRFTYELTTHGPYDPAISTTAGMDAASAFEWHPVLDLPQERAGQLLHVDSASPGAFLIHARRSADQHGVAVRLLNVASAPGHITVGGRRFQLLPRGTCEVALGESTNAAKSK